MIRHFKDQETEKFFTHKISYKLPYHIQRITLRKLLMIDAAMSINDIRVPPSNHLEKLKGKRAGQYSIRINEQWRICFSWQENNAYNVEIVDYHT